MRVPDPMPIRLVYRSRGIQYPLIAAMRAADAWRRAGLDPGPEVPYVKGASQGDAMLLNGEIQFIFGSHVTPYLRYDEGRPFVYLGQTVNCVDDVLISRRPVPDLAEVHGWRLGDDLGTENHPHGNHMLYLRRAGIPPDGVRWVQLDRDDAVQAVGDGTVDAVFAAPPEDVRARRLGLAVHVPPVLPMVQATTLTTTWATAAGAPELCRRLVRAVRTGVAFFQDEPDAMWSVMRDDVARSLGIEDDELLRVLFERDRRLLSRSLYPHPLAIENAFQLAVMQRPDLAERVVPTALWDVHFLREVDAEERPAG